MSAESTSGVQRDADAAKLLIERERDVFGRREETARNVDTQAAAITAATVAVAAIAADGDVLRDAKLGWVIVAWVFVLLSVVAAGIARVPALPPLNARQRRERILSNHPNAISEELSGFAISAKLPRFAGEPTVYRLGRDLGSAIRASEAELRGLGPETSMRCVTEQLLYHWRLRNGLARYRMHSKSSWLTVSIVCLYVALLAAAAGVLL